MRTIHSLLLCYKYTCAACFVFYVIKIENNNRISSFCFKFAAVLSKNNEMAKFLTSREENYSQWYNDLVVKGRIGREFSCKRMYGD